LIKFNGNSDEIAGNFSCSAGGVLAIGGSFFSQQTHLFRGTTFVEISEIDVVVQVFLLLAKNFSKESNVNSSV
jgi:hypothetical protein